MPVNREPLQAIATTSMTRQAHDRFAELLALLGSVETSRNVPSEVWQIDVQNLSESERELVMNLTPAYQHWREETLDDLRFSHSPAGTAKDG